MAIAEAHSLHVRNLSKFYGPVAAVDDVSFSVPRGAFLTLLGPSGSGKTTILMALSMSDDIAILRQGKIVQMGSTAASPWGWGRRS